MNLKLLDKQEQYANKQFRKQFNKRRRKGVKANSWHDQYIRNEVALQWPSKEQKKEFEKKVFELHQKRRMILKQNER